MPIRRRVYNIYLIYLLLKKSQQQYLSGNCSLSIQSVSSHIVFMENVCDIIFEYNMEFFNL